MKPVLCISFFVLTLLALILGAGGKMAHAADALADLPSVTQFLKADGTLNVASASWHFAREITLLSGFL